MAESRMVAVLYEGEVRVRSYLGTFRFEPVPGAPWPLSVTIQKTTETVVYDPDGCSDAPPIFDAELDF